MSLIRPSKAELATIESKLERAGIRPNARAGAGKTPNRVLYQILSSMGFMDHRNGAGGRAEAPNYAELGMTRVGGKPTEEEMALYKQVTGGELTENGFVCQALLFDNDLITDRYSIATLNALSGLLGKYLGRANDFDHSFDATQARSRIIGLGLGADPGTALHKDVPIDSLQKLSPNNPYARMYTALYATVAFPSITDPLNTIERVQAGLVRDISIAWSGTGNLCSICLEPMEQFWCWTLCEEHGFPGGRDEDTGQAVVGIMDGVSDAFTFGLVSDGAVKRAMLVLDPTSQEK